MFDGDFDSPYQLQALPVIQSETVATGDAEEMSPENSLGSKLRFERLLLFEILEDLDTRGPFSNSIPDKIQTVLLAQLEGRTWTNFSNVYISASNTRRCNLCGYF